MPRSNFSYPNFLTTGATSLARLSPPIIAKPLYKEFVVAGNTYRFTVPNSFLLDPEELISNLVVTGAGGTATIATSWEEADDPFDSFTSVPTATLAAAGTTLVVTDATNIPNAVTPILIAQFAKERTGGTEWRLSSYELAVSTSKSSNTLTIERGLYEAGKAFTTTITSSVPDTFVFFGTQWNQMRDSGNNLIQNTGVTITGATPTAPITSRLALASEGLVGLGRKAWRQRVDAASSSTATYRIDVSGRETGVSVY